MKHLKKSVLLLILALVLSSVVVWAQENKFSLSSGYVFGNIEDDDTKATGWRINGTYEFIPNAGKFSHGLTFGYIGTTADFTSNTQTSNYKLNSFPIYYEPKYTVGSGKLQGFVKGALGTHVTSYKRSGALTDINTTDMGFYGGAGAGAVLNMSEKVFIRAEYEWVYMSNTSYRDGFVNSAMIGIGINF